MMYVRGDSGWWWWRWMIPTYWTLCMDTCAMYLSTCPREKDHLIQDMNYLTLRHMFFTNSATIFLTHYSLGQRLTSFKGNACLATKILRKSLFNFMWHPPLSWSIVTFLSSCVTVTMCWMIFKAMTETPRNWWHSTSHRLLHSFGVSASSPLSRIASHHCNNACQG